MSGAVGSASLTAAARTTLAELAELLIPAGDGMPGAGEMDVAGAQLDRVLAARPDLTEPVLRAVGRPEPAAELLARLKESDPASYNALCLAVAGGYYMHAEVRRRLGYDGQRPVEVVAEIIPVYIEEGLLDSVLERGPRFRPATDSPGRSAGPSREED